VPPKRGIGFLQRTDRSAVAGVVHQQIQRSQRARDLCQCLGDCRGTQEVNLRGPMLCTHAVLPGMIERRHGRIINVSSGAAEISLAYLSSYIVSKAALNKMTELLAVETKQYGIAMFAISPGAVHTAMSEAFLKSEKAAKWMPWFRPMFAEHAVPPERQRPKLWRVSAKRDAVKPARRNFETRLASRIFPSNCLSPLRRGGGDCVLQPCGEVRLRLSGGSGRAVDAASIALACFDGEAPVRSSRLTTGPEVNVGTDDSAYSRGSDRYPGKMRIVQPRNLLHLVLASGFSLSAQVGPFAGSVSLTSVSNQVVALPKGPNPVFTNVVVDATAAGGGSIDVNVGDPTSYGTSESIATSEKPPLRRFRSMDCRSPNLNPAHRIST